MWWLALSAGIISVGAGLAQLAASFRDGLEDRSLAQRGPAAKLVRVAVLVTGGLFVGFVSTANLLAARMGTP